MQIEPNHLRAWRRRQRLTQAQLAKLAHVHPTYVAKIETGEHLGSEYVRRALADALGRPVGEVFPEGGDGT